MKTHKHAEVLRAIADGVPLDEFEVQANPGNYWVNMAADGAYTSWIGSPDSWEVRRKPQYIMVNGFKVPKPLDAMPQSGCVYTPHLQAESFYDEDNAGSKYAEISLKRGMAHSMPKAAIAHAKAMLGIDPEAE